MTASSSGSRFALALALCTGGAALPACNFNKLAANQTASIMEEAAPALDGFWDYDLAGLGIPGAIMQLEAFHAISPENEGLALNLAKAYVGYANGWVEADYEVAYQAGELDRADRLRQRARLMYLRAHNLALGAMRRRDPGIDDAMKSNGERALARYLEQHYDDASDAAPVFWAGMALGAAINMSLDQPDLIAEMPTAKTLVQRVKALDDTFFHGAAYLFLATMDAAFPAALGGNPEAGRLLFEEGLKKTGRKNHLMLIAYARVYAVNTQNRELFVSLLTEVIDAPDQGADVRLSNKVARRRAERYLATVDDLF